MKKKAKAGFVLALGMVWTAAVSAGAAAERCGDRRVTIAGTEKADRLTGSRGTDVISGLGGMDVIKGFGGRDFVCGGAGDDKIIVANGDDKVWGQRGRDTMLGGRGDDRLDGGDSADTATYKKSETPVDADLTTRSAIGEGADALLDVERLVGSDHRDTLTGDEAKNAITGLKGADRIEGLGGSDVQKSGAGDDRIHGGEGGDSHRGGPGDDFMDGGDGSDTLSFKFSRDPVVVDLAERTAEGEGSDTFINMEIVAGSRHGDTIFGDDTANTFYPLGGDDEVDGGGGFDFVIFVQSPVAVIVDLLDGTATGEGDDTLTSVEGVVGSAYGDTLKGDNGDNAFYGVGGDDHLDGRGGSDLLSGGPDTDTCTNGETLDSCE